MGSAPPVMALESTPWAQGDCRAGPWASLVVLTSVAQWGSGEGSGTGLVSGVLCPSSALSKSFCTHQKVWDSQGPGPVCQCFTLGFWTQEEGTLHLSRVTPAWQIYLHI
jgi:hypothetical protein